MKIACICNLNHAQFILARYLRDMGHEVTLFLMEEYPHFYPENDTYGPIEHIKIVELTWKHKDLYKIRKEEILQKLYGFDFYSGSDFAPAFLFKAGLPLDIFIPIGTDLSDYPFQKPKGFIPPTWAIDEYQFHLYQKAAIRNAGAIFMNEGGDENLEKALRKIKFKGKRYPISLPYLYMPDYTVPNAVSLYEDKIKELRNNHGLLLISHGRCEFLDKKSVHYKGTEIMLDGFARYIRAGNTSACLVMLEYGNDWQAAKEMSTDLGIEQYIHWLPRSSRKDIFPILKYFDAGFGTLSYPHWSYNVAMELIAARVPMIKRSAENQSIDKIKYQYFGVKEVSDIMVVLRQIAATDSFAKEVKAYAFDWYKNSEELALDNLKSWFLCSESREKREVREHRNRVVWIYYSIVLKFFSALRFLIVTRLRQSIVA